jgi:23S rRNA pseudouridine2605 synthase
MTDQRSPRGRRPGRPARPSRPERPIRITSKRSHVAAAPTFADEGPRPEVPDDGRERLQKVLAAAGLGSRRACEELITTGRVEVDRQVVTQLGTRVDPHAQEIRVDGERLPHPQRVVFMLNKPVGVVTTNYDPSGRPRVVDLVPGDQRLFAIGRLDRMSEGLILLTNDGGLANLLAHPRYGVEKKYLVQVAGVPTEELLDRLRRGIRLAEGEVHAKRVSIRSQHKQSAVLEMILDEGKNREIRRMLARLGHKVHQLKRVAVGGLSLGNLLPGQCRQLAWSEIEELRRDALAAVGPDAEREPPPPARRGGPPRRGKPFPSGPRGAGRPGQPGGGRPGKPGGGRPGKPGGGVPGRPTPRRPDGEDRPRPFKPVKGKRPVGRKRPGKASAWRKQRPAGGGE